MHTEQGQLTTNHFCCWKSNSKGNCPECQCREAAQLQSPSAGAWRSVLGRGRGRPSRRLHGRLAGHPPPPFPCCSPLPRIGRGRRGKKEKQGLGCLFLVHCHACCAPSTSVGLTPNVALSVLPALYPLCPLPSSCFTAAPSSWQPVSKARRQPHRLLKMRLPD